MVFILKSLSVAYKIQNPTSVKWAQYLFGPVGGALAQLFVPNHSGLLSIGHGEASKVFSVANQLQPT